MPKQNKSFLVFVFCFIGLTSIGLSGQSTFMPLDAHLTTSQAFLPMEDQQIPDVIPAAITPEPLDYKQEDLLPLEQPLAEPQPMDAAKKHDKAKKQKEKSKSVSAKTKEQIQAGSELDFEVENKTGRTIYVTCFAYMKKRPFSRWRWDKSPVYELKNNQSTIVHLDPVNDEQDRQSTFGYLAVFNTRQDADDSVYELLPDKNKMALDLLIHLQGKKVVLEIEKYGVIGEFFDYDFARKDQKGIKPAPELDFVVENRTGKTIIVTCFVFQKKAKGTWLAQKTKEAWTNIEETRDDMSVWRFDKTPIITLQPGESGIIDVDTIVEPRDRRELKGYLGVFDEDERKQAEEAVYELLPRQNKIDLDKLTKLKNKKVILEVEQYGIVGDFFDYTIKPISRIDFTKIDRSKAVKR